jgi:cyclomaltodextrinase
VPDWVEHAVWWQVYPLGFVGAEKSAAEFAAGSAGGPGEPAHRLSRLTAWLDYAVALGVSGIALGPVFASSTHGYDTIDHFRIDPRLGDDADFDALVHEAHARGLKVLLDGVFNHVGRDFPAFQQVLAEGPDAASASWFRLTWPSGPSSEPDYVTFEGHPGLVALNHDEPAVADHVVRVMQHWIERGADGWRLDAAYAVPTSFWATVLPRIRESRPDAYFVGEVIHGDYPAFVQDSTVDAVTQYELWKAIWSAINERNLFELAWALKRHNGFLDTFAPLTFVGNHDTTRLATRLGDERHLPHALVVLLTVGGTPSIYYGDEQAFQGTKEDRAGGDDAVRPAFPATPEELASYGWPVYRLHQDLIGTRRRNPWLHHARTKAVHLTNEQFVFEVADDEHRLVVALNLADGEADGPTPDANAVIAGAASLMDGGTEKAHVTLPPHAWAILGVAGQVQR